MNSERFKRVEKIYHSVLNVLPNERNSFLQQYCGDDFELRKEVESLLSYGNDFDSRIDTPPVSLVAELFAEPETSNKIGKQINHYKIHSLLGKGGMGEVYLAYDSKLERKVAIKLLTGEFAPETNKINRFLREAKSASALSHPNILTVHEIGELNGTYYIVTEFIEGKTLNHYLAEENLPLDSVLDLALQIVSALSAAHEAGIIHRDIKPENIMVKKDGFVKVLDFGLAKLTDSNASNEIDLDAKTKTNNLTVPGLVIGTPKYMSPEQARGQKVDSRTDIFSFGIVLYEMIAGKPPFSGVNEIDTIGSILKDEPKKLSEHLPEISRELEHLVGKSLRKDREQRYQHFKDLSIDLNDIKKNTESGARVNQNTNVNVAAKTVNTTGSLATERRFSLVHALVFLLIFVGIAGVVFWFNNSKSIVNQTDSPLKTVEVVNWSSSPGETYSVGSFSPDAKMIAFASTQSGQKNIWVKQTNSGDSIQITKDEFGNKNPIWSPNGEELAFYSTRGKQAGIWRIPILGGTPKLVTAIDNGRFQLLFWSKDNLIYFESKNEISVVDAVSGQIKQVSDLKSKNIKPISTNISPDELRVVYITIDDKIWNVWINDLNGEKPVKLFESQSEIKNVFWHPDNKRVFFSSPISETFQVFVSGESSAQPKQLTFGDKDSFVVNVSNDGGKILFGSAKEESDIWGVKLDDSKEFTVASDINSELWASVSPDSKTIAYQSIKNPSQGNKLFYGDILTKSLEKEAQAVQLSPEGFLPIWSPDGQTIAFMRVVGEKYQLETIETSGSNRTTLVNEGLKPVNYSVLPYNRLQTSDFSWSPDGNKIAYISDLNGADNIWIVGKDGANNFQLSDNKDSNLTYYCPIWSADGKQISYTSQTNQSDGKPTFSIWILDTDKKVSRLLTQKNEFCRLIGWKQENELLIASVEGSNIAGLPTEVTLNSVETKTGTLSEITRQKDAYLFNIHLSTDAKKIAFAARRDGKDNIWTISTSGGEAKQATNNNDAKLYFSSLVWSPDNNTIFFGRQTRFSLLSMLTDFK